jgi:hypothetical protein
MRKFKPWSLGKETKTETIASTGNAKAPALESGSIESNARVQALETELKDTKTGLKDKKIELNAKWKNTDAKLQDTNSNITKLTTEVQHEGAGVKAGP